MKLLEKVRAKTGLTDYGISKKLRDLGVEISIPGVSGYNKANAKSMRLDVLAGLQELSGVSWAEFGKWLSEEFLKGKK